MDQKDLQVVAAAIETSGYPLVKAAWNRVVKDLVNMQEVCVCKNYRFGPIVCEDCGKPMTKVK